VWADALRRQGAAVRGRDFFAKAAGCVAIVLIIASGAAVPRAAEVTGEAEVEATPSLIREIQFMLQRLGMDPGPIDGAVGPQTVNAVHKFQEMSGLPVADPVRDKKVSVKLMARLRSEASRVILGSEGKPEPAAGPPAVAAAPAAPSPPPADRFADCPFKPEDFRIGGTQYTPDKFLQEGFDGSTARAVANLNARLDEARQLAENIGGSALLEVQRQARVLGYFTCRLKIEQASNEKR